MTERTKIVFLANPNNPTGTYAAIDEVRTLREKLPAHVLLVLDAAYAEYVRRNDYEAGIELVATTPNTVMTRTFSKIHGLAGLRLGWAYCPEGVADALNRIRGPFNVSTPAIAAGVAAIEDTAHEEASAAHNERWLPWLTAEIEKLGLKVTPSVANFLLIHFPKDAKHNARAADAFLKSRAIIVRRVDAYGLPNCAARDRRLRKRQPRGGRRARGLPQRGRGMTRPMFEQIALDRHRAHRLVDQPRHAPQGRCRRHHWERAHQEHHGHGAEARPHRRAATKARPKPCKAPTS